MLRQPDKFSRPAKGTCCNAARGDLESDASFSREEQMIFERSWDCGRSGHLTSHHGSGGGNARDGGGDLWPLQDNPTSNNRYLQRSILGLIQGGTASDDGEQKKEKLKLEEQMNIQMSMNDMTENEEEEESDWTVLGTCCQPKSGLETAYINPKGRHFLRWVVTFPLPLWSFR